MTCSLSESWAVAYFLAAVSILIFGIGVPTLVIQAIVPEDMRRITRRHWRPFLKWGFLLIIMYMGIALSFVWVLRHPSDIGPIDGFVTQLETLLTAYGIDINKCTAGGILITLAIVGLGIVWYLQLLQLKGSILRRLARKCKHCIRRKGFVNQEILDDIRYLGEHGETTAEKMEVLKVLESLAERVQDHKRYKGDGLEDIIKAIELILQKESNVESFIEGIVILKRILERVRKLNFGSSADAGSVLRAFLWLGNIAFSWGDERPARKMLEAVEFSRQNIKGIFKDVALIFLELGKEALAKASYLVAVEALSKLEAMTWPYQPLDAQSAAAYLGLVAHFWVEEGSARQRALSSLEGVDFSGSRDECLKKAQEIHFNAARFDTADKLARMLLS